MKELAQADTQYGDAFGTIMVDGWDGLSITDLVESWDRHHDYVPIGLKISQTDETRRPLTLEATVLCVDRAQVGDDVRAYCKAHGEITTFEVSASVSWEKLAEVLKRVSIVLLSRELEDVPKSVWIETTDS